MGVTETTVYNQFLKQTHVSQEPLEATFIVTFDSSYSAGGEAWDANAKSGATTVTEVIAVPQGATLGGMVVQYDYTNKKLIAYVEEAVAAGGPLVEASGDLSTLLCRVTVKGLRT